MSHSLAYCPTVKSLKRAGFTTRTMPRHTHTTEMPEHSEPCSGTSHASGWRDLNPRPLDPQSSALPNCATARYLHRTQPPDLDQTRLHQILERTPINPTRTAKRKLANVRDVDRRRKWVSVAFDCRFGDVRLFSHCPPVGSCGILPRSNTRLLWLVSPKNASVRSVQNWGSTRIIVILSLLEACRYVL